MTTNRHTKQPPEVVTSIRLTREQYDAMKQIAERNTRSLSGELRKMVRDRVAAENGLDDPTPTAA